MTRARHLTEARLRRTLAAAREEGFNAVRFLPDGTVIIGHQAAPASDALDRELEEFEARHDAELGSYEATDGAD
jgi:hypothetical protein